VTTALVALCAVCSGDGVSSYPQPDVPDDLNSVVEDSVSPCDVPDQPDDEIPTPTTDTQPLTADSDVTMSDTTPDNVSPTNDDVQVQKDEFGSVPEQISADLDGGSDGTEDGRNEETGIESKDGEEVSKSGSFPEEMSPGLDRSGKSLDAMEKDGEEQTGTDIMDGDEVPKDGSGSVLEEVSPDGSGVGGDTLGKDGSGEGCDTTGEGDSEDKGSEVKDVDEVPKDGSGSVPEEISPDGTGDGGNTLAKDGSGEDETEEKESKVKDDDEVSRYACESVPEEIPPGVDGSGDPVGNDGSAEGYDIAGEDGMKERVTVDDDEVSKDGSGNVAEVKARDLDGNGVGGDAVGTDGSEEGHDIVEEDVMKSGDSLPCRETHKVDDDDKDSEAKTSKKESDGNGMDEMAHIGEDRDPTGEDTMRASDEDTVTQS